MTGKCERLEQVPAVDDKSRNLEAAIDQAVAWYAQLTGDDVSPERRVAFEAWRQATPEHAEA